MRRIVKLLLFLLLAALNFNLILKPLHLVTGGTQGLALIIDNYLDINPSLILLFINIIMFFVCYLFLDIKTTQSILLATFIYPFFVRATSFNNYISDNVLFVLISGVISGITISNILKLEYSTGGLNVLVLILRKYFNIKEYISNFVINSLIILLGIGVFGIKKAVLGIIIIIINSIVIRWVLRDVKNCQIS